MEKKKVDLFKAVASVLFGAGILGMYLYVCLKGDIKYNILSLACVGASFVLALLFVRISKKKILISVALLFSALADFFVLVAPSLDFMELEKLQLLGLCLYCGVQLCLLLYTLTLSKSIGLNITNIAFRVLLCLLAWFLIPKYLTLTRLQMIAVMYFLNACVTLLSLLFYFKKNPILFFGVLLLLAASVFVGLTHGAAEIFHITGKFMEIITKYNIAFFCYIPAVYLIALSSVWEKD